MGYDLHIWRNVFITREDAKNLPQLKGKNKMVVVSELFDSLNGWEVSEVVNEYISDNKEEVSIETLKDIYKSCKIKISSDLLEILNQDEENADVYYELSQSY
jgi:peroxiredoxin family protein